MGHVRLGYLPKTNQWRDVVALLDANPNRHAEIAASTIQSAEGRLNALRRDPVLGYCFWLLTRISWASRGQDFASALADLGIHVRQDDTALSFIARVTDHVEALLAHHPESGPFAQIASLAMRRALTETVGQEGRSLFGSSLEDLQAAFRRHSTPVRFGTIAKSYFSDVLVRSLHYFVDRELASNVGSGHALTSLEDSRAFREALDLYARQSARIMETFAEDWYSKRNWLSEGQISRDDAGRFVAHALRKLNAEITRPRS